MKKKIFLLSTFIIVSVVVLCYCGKKEVKAEDQNCQTYYNYYLFLDGTNKSYMNFLVNKKDPYHYITSKTFTLGVPEGAEVIDEGMIEFVGNTQNSNATKWTLTHYYDIFTSSSLTEGEVETYEDNGTNYSYARAYLWQNEEGQDQTGVQDPPSNSTEFVASVPEFFGNPTFNSVTIGTGGIDSSSSFKIQRTWSKATISALGENVKVVLSPAAYYVSYKLCEETPVEPEDTYTLTVKHLHKDTNEELMDTYTKKGYKTGDKDDYNCPAIDGYTVVDSSNNPSKITVEFEDKDITKECYYEENTYTLTINYGEDENCSKTIATSDTYDGLKAGDVKTHEIKNNIGDLTNPKLGSFSKQFTTNPTLKDNKLSITMPSKNVEVCIVYTPKTGASWIYLVWVIGGLALGYSIWYFVRYYKRQNSEI